MNSRRRNDAHRLVRPQTRFTTAIDPKNEALISFPSAATAVPDSGVHMTRYVIDPDVALTLAEYEAAIPTWHQLFAPTLLRSEILSKLFGEVRRGGLSEKEAHRRLDYLRKLRIRLLGDRVLQHVAWSVAVELRWSDTFQAEYVALTKLQGDALVTMDAEFASVAGKIVTIGSIDDLLT